MPLYEGQWLSTADDTLLEGSATDGEVVELYEGQARVVGAAHTLFEGRVFYGAAPHDLLEGVAYEVTPTSETHRRLVNATDRLLVNATDRLIGA